MSHNPNILSSPTLVLNKFWAAIQLKPVRKVLRDAIKGKVLMIDYKDWNVYSFEEWATLPVEEGDDYIRAGRDKDGNTHKIRCPGIALHKYYAKVPRLEVRMNRKNLHMRDGGKCLYCGVHVKISDASYDHVIPKSRGGPTTWENMVTCCLKCNCKKADKTLAEVGYTLKVKPVKPEYLSLHLRAAGAMKKGWEKFFPNL